MFKTLPGILFVLLSGTALAQTGDGMPPPNEGICDELIGGTPGLYGLCVAFSEAQDCEPDFTLGNPFENCTPSSPKLLELYDKKKTESDPPMPGVAFGCPCWTQTELAEFSYPDQFDPGDTSRCLNEHPDDNISDFNGWWVYTSTLPWHRTHIDTRILTDGTERNVCYMIDHCWDGNCLQANRYLEISDDEYVMCTSDVQSSGIDRGFDCWD